MAQTDREGRRHRVPVTEDVAPSRATYLAVARARDCDPLDLPPLAGTVDPDGLDALVDGSADAEGVAGTFEYAGCSVTVTAEEVRVVVR